MAQAEHLPIYKAAYDLCLYFEQIVQGFSRYHKGSSQGHPLARTALARERPAICYPAEYHLMDHHHPATQLQGLAFLDRGLVD